MRIFLIALATVIAWQDAAHAAARTWKSRKGVEVKAEFTGVKNGKAILKLPGGVRQPVRLSDFSLEDRDYLVDLLTKRNKKKDRDQLLQLMAAENAVKVVDPDAVRRNPDEGLASNDYEALSPGLNDPLDPSPLSPSLPGQTPAVETETEMYGLPLPSSELLVEDKVRTWTSLTGLTQLATFDRVLAPGFLRLKKADGSTGNFAIVNFVKEDIEYVKQVLQTDMARPVFPEGSGFQSLTPEDVSKGYRVWTDRKKVPLVGKFVGVKGKNVVIEVDGENKEYPKAGLSEADRTRVNNEVRRRAEEAAARAQANSSSAGGHSDESGSPFRRPTFPSRPTFPRPPRFGAGGHSDMEPGDNYADAGHEEARSPFGRRPVGSRFGAGNHGNSDSERPGGRFGSTGLGMSPVSTPEYSFNCEHCGRSWTDSMMYSRCPNCKDKYHFECDRCGHKWTRTDSILSKCPKCSGEDSGGVSSVSNSGSGGSAAPKEGQGVLMTIVYVALGLSVLGSIAGGLFRAFG